MANKAEGNVRPGRKSRSAFKPKNGNTEISRSEFEAARNDTDAIEFVRKAKAEGERLESEGLIHR